MEADKILSIKFFEKNISLKPKAGKYKNGFNRPVSFMNNDKKIILKNILANQN